MWIRPEIPRGASFPAAREAQFDQGLSCVGLFHQTEQMAQLIEKAKLSNFKPLVEFEYGQPGIALCNPAQYRALGLSLIIRFRHGLDVIQPPIEFIYEILKAGAYCLVSLGCLRLLEQTGNSDSFGKIFANIFFREVVRAGFRHRRPAHRGFRERVPQR